MLKSLFGETSQQIERDKRFGIIYLAMLLLSLHWGIVLFVHSTYLGQFVDAKTIGTLFTIGSALTVFAFLFISRILQKLGNYKLTLGLTALEFVVLIGMGFATSLEIAVPLFILHQAIVPLILFNLDVFVESMTTTENRTGSKRGIMLTTMSLATAFAPLCAGFLIGDTNTPHFTMVYMLSAFFLIPFSVLIWRSFSTFTDAHYPQVEVLTGIRSFWIDRNLRFVFLAHFLLQLFFSWMVIYVPLYLATSIGMTWNVIGQILFVGLCAYVLFEYPIGKIADLYIGEKEMMIGGFIILGVSTAWISFLETAAIVPWMVTMFLTRIGASFVEATTESYFFKHTSGSDANIISFFRITRPLAIVGGALLGSLALLYMPFQYIFIALGLSMSLGILCSFFLVDTK